MHSETTDGIVVDLSVNDLIAVIICSALYAPVYVTYIYDYNLIIMNVKLKLINHECEKKKKMCNRKCFFSVIKRNRGDCWKYKF